MKLIENVRDISHEVCDMSLANVEQMTNNSSISNINFIYEQRNTIILSKSNAKGEQLQII